MDAAPGGANPLTPRRESDGGAPDGALRERLQGAHVSARHRATLEGPARGAVELPGLGRVEVSARDQRGAVDLDLQAARVETLQALRAHAPALVAEVEAARIPVGRVTFEGATPQGAWDPGGSRNSARDPREEAPEAPPGTTPETLPARPRGRVRFVL